MSHIKQVHVGDSGVLITLTIYEDNEVKDISASSDTEIRIKKPSGVVHTQLGTFTTDGTDGKLECTTEADVFDEEGRYEVRGHFVLNFWEGSTSELIVHAEAVE